MHIGLLVLGSYYLCQFGASGVAQMDLAIGQIIYTLLNRLAVPLCD